MGLGLTQDEMAARLGLSGQAGRVYVSKFERGEAEPPLKLLLVYGQLAGVYVEAIIDDDVDLPRRLPCSPKSEGIRRKSDHGHTK